MRKSKKVKTVIVEKYKFDGDEYITLCPTLLKKLLMWAHSEAKSELHLHEAVDRVKDLMDTHEVLHEHDYYHIVSPEEETIPPMPVPTPPEMEGSIV